MVACTWFIAVACMMRYVPWSNGSFPFELVTDSDFERALSFAAITAVALLVFFAATRALMMRWYGREADPIPHALAVYTRGAFFRGAMASAAVAQMIVLALSLRPARVLFYLYSDPTRSLFSSTASSN